MSEKDVNTDESRPDIVEEPVELDGIADVEPVDTTPVGKRSTRTSGSVESTSGSVEIKVPGRSPRGRAVVAAAVGALIALAALAGVFGYKWQSVQGELDRVQADQSSLAAATEVAREYTERSLTYDYRDVDAFFDGVNRGATKSLQDEYEKARGDLQTLMVTAQVVASGDIIATSVLSSADERYEFAVTAIQKTKNLQQPEEAQVPNVLKVVVVRDGDTWLVDKYSSM